MITSNRSTGRTRALWRAGWPSFALVIFESLAVVRVLPGGYDRTVVAAPIALSVPGALTLGALLGRRRIDGLAFSCYAVLLSILWSAFASIILYVLHVLITGKSIYLCLLLICTALASAATGRLMLGSGKLSGYLAGPPMSAMEPDQQDGWRAAGYAIAASVAGIVLLAGGTYAYLHGPRPTPAGYTWIAWTGPHINDVVEVGPSGTTLPFQLEHQQSTEAVFRLTATWAGTGSSHPLAAPLTIHLGPDSKMNGKLAIPVPPDGCTYRIVVTLTQVGQAHQGAWSINADVRQRAQADSVCPAK
jgi:hypothetical protein